MHANLTAHEYLDEARKFAVDVTTENAINQVAWFVKLAPEYAEAELYSAVADAYRQAQTCHAGVTGALIDAIRVTMIRKLSDNHNVLAGRW